MKDLNEKFADTESAIQRYVLGRMSSSETEDFETYFIGEPQLIEQIEIAQNMHSGLANKAENARIVEKPYSPGSSRSIVEKLLAWITVPVPAFAVVALAAVLSPLALNGLSSVDTDRNIELLDFATTTTRSASQKSTIDLSQVKGQAALMVKVKSVKHPNYKLELVSEYDNDRAWKSDTFQVGALRDHLVLLPSSLKGQKYEVSVIGVNSDLTEVPVEFCHYSEVCN